MQVVLYQMSKRSNSTKRPANNTVSLTLNCLVKTPSSVIDPVLEIKKSGSMEVFDYNYCYIPDWKRYYFITNFSFNMGIWIVNCTVDVLASYKETIKASSQYLLRSAQVYNEDLIDSFYPTETPSARMSKTVYSGQAQNYFNSTWLDIAYFDVDIDDGVVIVGILSGSNTGVSYYCLNMATWSAFISQIQSYVPSDMGSLANGIAKALFDPIQYITYCRWFPARPQQTGGSVTTINIGNVDFNLGSGAFAYLIASDRGTNSFRLASAMNIPQHPQSASYPYLNQAPYTNYSLYFEPFGLIPIDSTMLYGASTLQLYWDIDFLTGASMLTVETNTGTMVTKTRSSIGVPLSLSKTTVSVDNGLVLGAVGFIASKGKDVASDLASSNKRSWLGSGDARNNLPYAWKTGTTETLLGALASNVADNLDTVKGVTDSLLSVMGQVSVSGTAGSFLIYSLRPVLYGYFMEQTAHDDVKFGRPAMQSHSLANMSGFIQCGNAAVDYAGTSGEAYPVETEKQAVVTFLNNGVYLE